MKKFIVLIRHFWLGVPEGLEVQELMAGCAEEAWEEAEIQFGDSDTQMWFFTEKEWKAVKNFIKNA